MADNVLKTRIRLKYDTRENWAKSELVLLAGELALDTKGTYKVGDGSHKWADLAFSGGSVSQVGNADPSVTTGVDAGTMWFNSTSDSLFIFDGTNWEKVFTADQIDGVYAPLVSPALTGTPTTSDVTAGTDAANSSQIANTKFVTTAVKNLSDLTVKLTQLGVATTTGTNAVTGVATLGTDGKVPSSQLPSYVDDIIEGTMSKGENDVLTFTAATGTIGGLKESGKIYVDTTDNHTYRWSGTQYTLISASLALGTTSSTAYAGDKGQELYNYVVDGWTKKETGKSDVAVSGLLTRADTIEAELAAIKNDTTTYLKDLAYLDTVDTAQIDDSAVTTAKIADSNVTTAKIADANVTADKLATDSVTTAKIVASAVTTVKIADANVTADKLATDSVLTAKIKDANVTTAKIADSAVTTAKITDANVTADKLATDSVLTAKIKDANVTTVKIADANVTADKLATDSVLTAKIKDGNVTTAKIADANVTTAKIADANVTTAKIADSAVTNAKIDTVEFKKITDSADGTVIVLSCGDAEVSATV